MAQQTGNLGVSVTITPPSLSLTVTSSDVDFGQLQADAGVVILDPVSGDMNTVSPAPIRLGEVVLAGSGDFHLSVISTPLRPEQEDVENQRSIVDYTMQMSRADGCGAEKVYEAVISPVSVSGSLSENDCTTVRFGGALSINDTAAGEYRGTIFVSVSQ